MCEIFYKILSNPQNIVMDMNNVMYVRKNKLQINYCNQMPSKILCPGSFVMVALAICILVIHERRILHSLGFAGTIFKGPIKTKSYVNLWLIHPNLIKLGIFFEFLMSFPMSNI